MRQGQQDNNVLDLGGYSLDEIVFRPVVGGEKKGVERLCECLDGGTIGDTFIKSKENSRFYTTPILSWHTEADVLGWITSYVNFKVPTEPQYKTQEVKSMKIIKQ